MFDQITAVARELREVTGSIEPGRLCAADAASAIRQIAECERLLAGARVRLACRIDDTVTGAEGENGPARWLARTCGVGFHEADRDLRTSERLTRLADTDRAVAEGELSPTQAHEVAWAAEADPLAERELLDTARQGSVAELRRAARKVRAAAMNNEDKATEAHENRDLGSNSDPDTGEGRVNVKGPVTSIAELLALLEPWVQAEFARARKEGRRERRGAYAFDALLAALRFADHARRGAGTEPGGPVPTGPPAQVLARIDVTAARRGSTVAGETCEIDGLGPVPVAVLRELLPQAAIDLIVTKGRDAVNVTHLGRSTLARQQVVLDWFGGQCTRQGCSATRNLQVDHRIDWAKVKVTELRNLDWLCVPDHHRKSHHGWALVPGRGRRRMVPPDDPDHPANSPPVPSTDLQTTSP